MSAAMPCGLAATMPSCGPYPPQRRSAVAGDPTPAHGSGPRYRSALRQVARRAAPSLRARGHNTSRLVLAPLPVAVLHRCAAGAACPLSRLLCRAPQGGPLSAFAPDKDAGAICLTDRNQARRSSNRTLSGRSAEPAAGAASRAASSGHRLGCELTELPGRRRGRNVTDAFSGVALPPPPRERARTRFWRSARLPARGHSCLALPRQALPRPAEPAND